MSDQERRAGIRPPGTLAARWEAKQVELRAEAAAHPENRAETERLAYERVDAARGYPFSSGRPGEVQVSAAPMSTFTVRFDPGSADALQDRATARGVGVVQMLRGWVLDRLAADENLPAGAPDEFGPRAPDIDFDGEEILLRKGRRLPDELAGEDLAQMRVRRAEM